MGSINITASGIVFNDPKPRTLGLNAAGQAENSFSIQVAGMGQLVGLAYTVPAHSSGTIKADLQISAMSSQDVKNLNDLAMSMLSASYQEEVKEYEKTSASANLSLWTWAFGGGGASASYEKTKNTMKSKGLTEAQITQLMDTFLDVASKMSSVQINFYVNNQDNDYSVSGDLYLYTVSGSISTEKGTQEYRMLADQAAAGGPPPTGGGAPASGQVISLN
ncbi:hypothetical protein [Jiella marina]|uniref:hypothetical protein n=1 Tax=Jiella sp. LLJ827 TaxID=2917712 RepID=UPI0021009E92|nr:hypothetical protein [Jiella sp. LLJ827]MCQ0988500.1 hypothetical protein [Jiella sp. LLJ827]